MGQSNKRVYQKEAKVGYHDLNLQAQTSLTLLWRSQKGLLFLTKKAPSAKLI